MSSFRIAFRPECLQDKLDLEGLLDLRGIGADRLIEIPTDGGPAALRDLGERCFAMDIASPDELAMLIEAMGEVEDGHRMLQTLDIEEHFTGDFVEGVQERAERILGVLEMATDAGKARSVLQPIIDEGEENDDQGLFDPQ